MNTIYFLYTEILIRPIITLLIAIYQGLLALGVPFTLGFSIIVLTIVIRLLLYPLTTASLRAAKKMQDAAPHVKRIRDKHKGDTKRIHAETMKIYQEHGINPVAGCLPMLLQLPMFIALYSVLQRVVGTSPTGVMQDVNKLIYPFGDLSLQQPLNTSFFGLALGKTPADLLATLPLILLVPVLTGVLQFLQTKMMAPEHAPEKPKNKQADTQEDFAAAFQTQSLYVLPVMIGFFAYSFPLGLALYWNTFTVFGILQQYHVQGWGGLTPWITKLTGTKKK